MSPGSNLVIEPGATIGILGSGQLGRMLAMAARRLGYGVAVYSPEPNSPAGQLADQTTVAAYDDTTALEAFAQSVDVVTFEFENVNAEAVAVLSRFVAVRPGGAVLHTTQHRVREKTFLASIGVPTTPWRSVKSLDELNDALQTLGTPAVLKTAGFGYDGKGQRRIDEVAEAEVAFAALGSDDLILEAHVDFVRELSVVAARGQDGRFVAYPIVENRHRNHVLDLTLAPAPLSADRVTLARALARRILDALDVVGVLAVELFEGRDGRLLVNELAPRPHNSGHFTLDACDVDQFELQLRAVCGLPLLEPRQRCPAVMANLLGEDLLGSPDYAAVLASRDVRLHLYGKAVARPGRKMGHLTALGLTIEDALSKALTARDAIRRA
ncbi:MAG: 5-(carboxyamino)imidazole ribonucleotide synthase [Myxococcales bacterium]|nr:5-(carboxyamino)imidazole ribonucleotide synthase [Myxococcales bacterium]